MLDANSLLPQSFVYSPLINTSTNPGTISIGAGVLHGFIIIGLGTGLWGATVYDALVTGTLNSTTAIGVLVTATVGGAYGLQLTGDGIYNTGLTVVNNTGTTAGAFKILYL